VSRRARERAWREKLLNEARLLTGLGYLADSGDVHCPECGELVERSSGWRMVFACSCGWRMEDLEQ
jgi:hypothetical protein